MHRARGGDIDMTPTTSPDRTKRTYDFDIHIRYHDAVEQVAERDATILRLRSEISSKSERISVLEIRLAEAESRLVGMSLELASSKAMQDERENELRMLKRSISNVTDDGCGDGRSEKQRRRASAARPAARAVDYAPVRYSHKLKHDGPSGRNEKDAPEPVVAGVPRVRCVSDSLVSTDHDVSRCDRRRELRSQRRGYSLSLSDSLRGWGAGSKDDRATTMRQNGRSGALDEARREFAGANAASFERATANAARTKHLGEPSENHMDAGQMRHCSSDMALRGNKTNRTRQSSWGISLDCSDASRRRRLSDLGRFMLGLNNHNADDDAANTTGCLTTEKIKFDDCQKTARTGAGAEIERKSSSRSLIEGVIFPVSSQEVLAGCLVGSDDELAKALFGSSSRRVSSNEEWPEFK